ncbi:MAG: hypothetical protein NWR47_06780 [Aestuariivirgaceae bacterium]|nr:hypothetical protein [Aestuariivirgaceae bacterium]
MAFERLMAELSLLLQEVEKAPRNKHALYLEIREKLQEMRALDLPVPADLEALERRLEAEFSGTAPNAR